MSGLFARHGNWFGGVAVTGRAFDAPIVDIAVIQRVAITRHRHFAGYIRLPGALRRRVAALLRHVAVILQRIATQQ